MSHDAHWFSTIAGEYGLDAVNRHNKAAVRELGKTEARRIVRAVGLSPVRSLDDCIFALEVIIALSGPRLIDYRTTMPAENSFTIHVDRCFAHEKVLRAGILPHYDCGILPRVLGWFDSMDVDLDISPPLARCLKADGGECRYTFSSR